MANEHFSFVMPFTIGLFLVILDTHSNLKEFDNELTDVWSRTYKKNANDFMHALARFYFIIHRCAVSLLSAASNAWGNSEIARKNNPTHHCITLSLKSNRCAIYDVFSKNY